MKQMRRDRHGGAKLPITFEPIDMPRNNPTGFITAFFAVVTGFALIWHISWLVLLGLLGALVTTLVFAWRDVAEVEIPSEVIAKFYQPPESAE